MKEFILIPTIAILILLSGCTQPADNATVFSQGEELDNKVQQLQQKVSSLEAKLATLENNPNNNSDDIEEAKNDIKVMKDVQGNLDMALANYINCSNLCLINGEDIAGAIEKTVGEIGECWQGCNSIYFREYERMNRIWDER